jgi:hypothetical protein
MKKRSFVLFPALGVMLAALIGVFLFNTKTAATGVAYTVEQKLKSQEIAVFDVIFSEDVLSVTIGSSGVDRVTPEDMLAYRLIRDDVRLLDIEANLNIRIVSTAGNIIFEETLNHLLDIPEFGLKIDETAGIVTDTEKILRDELAALGFDVQLVDVANSEFGGKNVCIELWQSFDIDEVNRTVQEFVTLIDVLNEEKDVVVSQYRLSVSDEADDLLVQLSADLIQRSFSWWQSPRLGNETWTGNTPKTPPAG